MGFFKDIKKLNDQGKEMREQYPLQQQLANASAGMAQANQMMANMAQCRDMRSRMMDHMKHEPMQKGPAAPRQ